MPYSDGRSGKQRKPKKMEREMNLNRMTNIKFIQNSIPAPVIRIIHFELEWFLFQLAAPFHIIPSTPPNRSITLAKTN